MPGLVASISEVKIATFCMYTVNLGLVVALKSYIFPLRDSKKQEIGRDFLEKRGLDGKMCNASTHRTLEFFNEALKLPIAL